MELGIQNGITSGAMAERRGTTRFPLQEEVRYRVLQPARQVSPAGRGRTLNFGSGGILFTTETELEPGRTMEISVNWPARLGGTCALQFVAMGRVVWAAKDRAAVRIDRYEFKTRAETSELSAVSGQRSAFGPR
jgi:hypothetical protein